MNGGIRPTTPPAHTGNFLVEYFRTDLDHRSGLLPTIAVRPDVRHDRTHVGVIRIDYLWLPRPQGSVRSTIGADLFNHLQELKVQKDQERNTEISTDATDPTPTGMKGWTSWESDGGPPLPASPAGQTTLRNCSSSPFSCPFCSAFPSVSYVAEGHESVAERTKDHKKKGSASWGLWHLLCFP